MRIFFLLLSITFGSIANAAPMTGQPMTAQPTMPIQTPQMMVSSHELTRLECFGNASANFSSAVVTANNVAKATKFKSVDDLQIIFEKLTKSIDISIEKYSLARSKC